MVNVEIGDVLNRCCPGFRNEIWKNKAEVIELSTETISCLVFVDVPRTMIFNRETGINVLGREYGWLEAVE